MSEQPISKPANQMEKSSFLSKLPPFAAFLLDCLNITTKGRISYNIWMGVLTALMLLGTYAYAIQLQQGLIVTGMNDRISWGLYISNFTFLVGIAAASVMVVIPSYVFHEYDFSRSVLIGEGMAVSALIMCLAFVIVDMGGPARLWHMIPGVGLFNFPQSMLAWDVIVLNGYLLLNIGIPFYIIFSHYQNKIPNPKLYVPLIFFSIFWAISIHLVTAFLYAGLVARPFWNSSLLGPRFLASAFAGGTALMIIALHYIKRATELNISDRVFYKLSLIVVIAAQVNIVMLISEIFKEFYYPTEHSASAQYLFFGLDGHNSLSPWIWTALFFNVSSIAALLFSKVRQNRTALVALCAVLFVSIWIEKGLGLIIPGFIPTPLGEVVDYYPTWVEIAVTVGIWALGLFVFTLLVKVAVAVEKGDISLLKFRGEASTN